MNKRHYEHTLPNIRGSLSNTYIFKVNKNPRAAPFHYPHKAAVAVYGLMVQGVSSGRQSAEVKIHLSHGYMIEW